MTRLLALLLLALVLLAAIAVNLYDIAVAT